jgi:hypothetical protein
MSDFGRLQELAREAGLQIYPPAMVDIPYVSPDTTAAIGDTLSCTSGNWNGEPTGYTYSWQHLDQSEVGTGNTYVVAAGDAAHSLVCLVTATNGVGSTTATPSNAVFIPAVAAAAARHPVPPASAHIPAEHLPAHDARTTEPTRRK